MRLWGTTNAAHLRCRLVGNGRPGEVDEVYLGRPGLQGGGAGGFPCKLG